jgi:polyhydroxybutyrate depolymerase
VQDPTDDVGCAAAWASHVASLLDVRGLSLDRSRIYSTGMSNGGFMSLRLGCQSAPLFAAVATVTGVLGNESPTTDDFPCDIGSTGGLPVPMLHIHGTADSTVPYSAAARGIEVYRALNNCSETGPPIQTYANGAATCASYCPAPLANVTLCSVEGGGHEWFGSPLCGIVSGNAAGCQDLQSTRQVWEFFKRHTRELAPASAL